MRIQYLNGGLANQTFQYIFARFAELAYPEGGKVLLDDSFFFFNQIHNGYELERVYGIKANLLSRYFTEDVWSAIVEERKKGAYLGDILRELDMGYRQVWENSEIKSNAVISQDGQMLKVKVGTYVPDIVRAKDNVYYHGYWMNKNYFEAYRNILERELTFPPITEAHNLAYAQDIEETCSVALHVRRGDFVRLNLALPYEFYQQQIQMIHEAYSDAVFFVFSDEPEFCREHAHEFGFDCADRTVYVEGNNGSRNYRDLQLMSMCKGIVLDNSSFTFLGGY